MSDYNPIENPYKWGSENLSKPRFEAFKRALTELQNNKWTPEYSAIWQELQNVERAFHAKQAEEIGAIYEQERKERAAIEQQIKELQAKDRAIRDEAAEKVSELRSKVYSDPDYKAKDEQLKEAAKHSKALFVPKLANLIDKYAAAQKASDIKSA